MLGYVTFVAILNLGLGYALAVYLRGSRGGLRQFIAELTTTATQAAEPPNATSATTTGESNDCSRSEKPIAAQATSQESPASPVDPQTGLASRDHAEQVLTGLSAEAHREENPAAVVLMELEPSHDAAEAAGDRLLCGVAKAIGEMMEEAHTAARYGQQQFLLVLPGDDITAATKRTEEVRQRIEATEFMADDQALHGTLTCAMAELSSGDELSDLLESLQETLDLAKRKGGNRTYLYDGMTPAPVVPPELNLATQQFAI
jgi:diguanylate cyclase (GGDEF)-like protein